MGTYNPKSVLRRLSPESREALGRRRGSAEGWGSAELSIKELYGRWQDLPPDKRQDVDRALQGVQALSTPDAYRNIRAEAVGMGVALAPELDAMESLADRALWVALEKEKLFERALRFAQVDDMAGGRSWYKRLGMPTGAADLSDEALEELRNALRIFYSDHQGRGTRANVEYLTRGDGSHFLFCLLSDYADRRDTLDESGQRVPRPGDPTFEVVFSWRDGSGAVEIYAEGGKPVVDSLRLLFARTILHGDPVDDDEKAAPFQLDVLLRTAVLPVDPADDVRGVYIRELDLDVVGRKDKGFTVRSRGVDDPRHIHQLVDEDLNKKELPRSVLLVKRAKVQIKLMGGGAFTFTVSRHACNLKNFSDAARVLGEKYLRKWNVDAAEPCLAMREYTGTVA